jgi:PAS domain S-box-containing protein
VDVANRPDYDDFKQIDQNNLAGGGGAWMSELDSLLIFLSDPRLAPHAIGEVPAWLWSADASRVLWGNPTAAGIFNIESPAALAGHTIDPKGTAALQLARLASTLPHSASPRLERLRGFGGRMGGALMCACSRITLANRVPAILVVATEPAGPRLPLTDQAQRLLAGIDEPAALFAADGSLLHATPAARMKLGRITTLAALNAGPLSATAFASGRAEGNSTIGKASFHRIGTEPSVLLATFEAGADMAKPTEVSSPPTATGLPAAVVSLEPPPTTAPPSPIEPRGAQLKPELPQPTPPAHAGRRKPLRFVWQMDAAGRFTLGSDEFKALLGPNTAAALDRPWSEVSQKLSLDPDGHIARALASHDTWSGITVAFPADSSDTRLLVELSGLPVFDRDRSFLGYRGFGVCRDLARMTELAQARQKATGPAAPRMEPPVLHEEPPVFRNESPSSTPAAENIVQFPASAPAEASPGLTPVERKAFSELANRLSARLRGQKDRLEQPVDTPSEQHVPVAAAPAPSARPTIPKERAPERAPAADQRPILDRLPVGVLVYRLDNLIYANRAFLDWTGYENLAALQEAGGLDALFVEPNESEPSVNNGAQSLTIATNRGDQVPVEARLFSSPWEGESALVLMLTGVGAASADDRQKAFEAALRQAKIEAGELRAIVDNAVDGVVVVDSDERVLSISRGGEALFGYASRNIVGHPFTTLFAQESQRAALDTLKRSPQNPLEGRDVIGRRREGGLVPLYMAVSPLTDSGGKLCATFRDMTRWKKTEGELLGARRQAEMASAAKSDFLAKISHEIRTPLNAIIGFSEVMMQERFGPIGNDRYRQYLKDIHASGGHLVSLLNDLLDLSKIEAGKLELNFAPVDLNELTQETVAMMQPQANRERIIIRTSLPNDLPQVTADARSVRQIVLNLLSNSIKFTGAGGQVIVSTARSDDGEVVLRVRDTGIGMSEQDLSVALEPFRQLATSARWGSSGTGLGLPLTKALAEANRARFKIQSQINTGTLVEVAFPGSRMAAE